MTSREKVLAALAHTPGPVPLDFGATAVTGIHCSIVEKLRDHHGLAKTPVKISDPYQMLGEIDADLCAALGIDTRPIPPRLTMFGYEQTGWKEWRTPWNQVVLVGQNFHITEKPDGARIHPRGNPSAEPCALLPGTGFFFDAINRQKPCDEDNLTLADNLEEFTDLSEADLAHWRRQAALIRDSGHQHATVASLPGTALGDIALVPGLALESPRGIRGVEDWYMLLASDENFVNRLFAAQTETALRNLEKIHAIMGDTIDAALVCGTDFGTQTGTFCSIEKFRRLWFPRYKTINDWIHKNTPWKTMKHSCGAIDTFLPDLIACGFDIINPVQCSATGMDPRHLKEKYGSRLAFWGGAIDTQRVLPFGTPAQVRAQARERLEIFSTRGGFVFNAIHNIQAGTPLENVLALLETLREFNQ